MFNRRTPIDLTLLIDERYPATWPGHVPFVRRTWNWYEETARGPEVWTSGCGPYFTEVLVMDEHIGTHFDAPSHFLPDRAPGQDDAMCGDQIDVASFCGAAVCIDVTAEIGSEPGFSPLIRPSHVLQAEQRLGRQLTSDDVVLLRSDWDERFYKPGIAGRGYAHDVLVTRTAPGWPAPDVDCIELLLERRVRCVGTDAPSMGPAHDGAPVHVAGLGGGMVFVEALSNLRAVPASGASFQFLPIKIARSSGGPGRAVAWIDAREDEERSLGASASDNSSGPAQSARGG